MFPLWNDVVAPVVEATGARRIVEVGALRGENTELMLERLGPDVELHVIDPLPEFDPAEHEAQFGGQYVFHRDLSVNVLGDLPPMDVALIDGDHNWYTVVTELRLLAGVAQRTGTPLPVCILHDVGWPYGRRDLYYNPDTIPDEHRQPWQRGGIRRGASKLVAAANGLNGALANAEHEGGPRNGVMTAVEDFIAEHDRPLRLLVVPIYFGLAILVEQALLDDRPELGAVLDRLESPEGKDMLLRLGEDTRLDAAVFDQILLGQRDRRVDRVIGRYLDTVKSAIVNDHHVESEARLDYLLTAHRKGSPLSEDFLIDPVRHGPNLVRSIEERHRVGGDAGDTARWTGLAHGGRRGLDYVHDQLDRVRRAKVAGGFAVCGVGQGGSALLAAAFLEAYDGDDFVRRQRPLWVLDHFRRAESHIDLNLMRDRLHRFDLLNPRVRLLQGDPAATADELADEQLAALVLGPGLGDEVEALLARLFPRLSPGGVLVVEPGDAALAAAVEAHRSRLGDTGLLERGQSGGLAWTKAEPLGEPVVVDTPVRQADASYSPLLHPAGLLAPDLSVIVVMHNMRREAARTLHALSPAYQQGMDGRRYEVVVVENGSSPDQRLGREFVKGVDGPFRYIDMGADARPSPVSAMNRGLAESRGRNVCLMIDGAHVLTPRVLHYGLAGLEAYDPAVVATQMWYVGPGQQGEAMRSGYDQAREDELFEQVTWPSNGYRLFDIGHFCGDRDWFDGLWESNCLFAPRALLAQVGGFDEGFSVAGGGFSDLDLYERLSSHPDVRLVTILGEASFHQVHGGTTTNQPDPQERRRRVASYAVEYAEQRGRPFMGPEKPIHFVGGFRWDGAKRSRARRMTGSAFEVDVALEGADGPAPESPVPIPDDLRDSFTNAYFRSLGWQGTRWLGQTVDNAPTDLLAYQEIIEEVRPDWVIETGAPEGGRALFLASICEMVGHGEVISISQHPRKVRPEHPRVRTIAATPHKPEALEQVRAIVGDDPRAMVILGSRTRRNRTRMEFDAFAPLVPVGSYVVIEHTVLNGFPVDASFGPGPHEALRRLMNQHGEFLADTSKERHGLTFNQGGFLKRIS